MKKKKVRVVFERDADPGWWVATVPELDGCLTQGKGLGQTRSRLREALALFLENAESVEFEEEFILPKELSVRVEDAKAASAAARAAQERAAEKMRAAVVKLEKIGVSRRDSAELMGLSFQRVQQIAEKH